MDTVIENDTQYQEFILTEVHTHDDGHSISFREPDEEKGGWGAGIPLGPIIPKVGDTIRFYGRGFGFSFRGVVVAGKVFEYRTEAEEEAYRAEQLAKSLEEQRAQYEADLPTFEARLAEYPEVYRKRILRFRENAPLHAWKHEGYEMMVCDAAMIMAEHFGDKDALKAWWDAGSEYKEVDTKLEPLGLSGNQFGMARRLAFWQLSQPENIWKDHAAISALVGCEEAGCPPIST